MSKTPEQLCKEWCKENLDIATHAYCYGAVNLSFLAGYQAAKDQFADTSKVMNSPEDPDSCEHILDMEKMVDVNGWISVKDRLPEHLGLIANEVIVCTEYEEVKTAVRKMDGWIDIENRLEKKTSWVTHWMPLPEPPKEKV
jgi:hypothetical protein